MISRHLLATASLSTLFTVTRDAVDTGQPAVSVKYVNQIY